MEDVLRYVWTRPHLTAASAEVDTPWDLTDGPVDLTRHLLHRPPPTVEGDLPRQVAASRLRSGHNDTHKTTSSASGPLMFQLQDIHCSLPLTPLPMVSMGGLHVQPIMYSSSMDLVQMPIHFINCASLKILGPSQHPTVRPELCLKALKMHDGQKVELELKLHTAL